MGNKSLVIRRLRQCYHRQRRRRLLLTNFRFQARGEKGLIITDLQAPCSLVIDPPRQIRFGDSHCQEHSQANGEG
ncbi:MAG: hypothetical protein LBD54_03315 [Puniceicoccales bacterium]|nr:hypothetical protein [Puniceicoccales bacterium]